MAIMGLRACSYLVKGFLGFSSHYSIRLWGLRSTMHQPAQVQSSASNHYRQFAPLHTNEADEYSMHTYIFTRCLVYSSACTACRCGDSHIPWPKGPRLCMLNMSVQGTSTGNSVCKALQCTLALHANMHDCRCVSARIGLHPSQKQQ